METCSGFDGSEASLTRSLLLQAQDTDKKSQLVVCDATDPDSEDLQNHIWTQIIASEEEVTRPITTESIQNVGETYVNITKPRFAILRRPLQVGHQANCTAILKTITRTSHYAKHINMNTNLLVFSILPKCGVLT